LDSWGKEPEDELPLDEPKEDKLLESTPKPGDETVAGGAKMRF
jgi:hypothetical protein